VEETTFNGESRCQNAKHHTFSECVLLVSSIQPHQTLGGGQNILSSLNYIKTGEAKVQDKDGTRVCERPVPQQPREEGVSIRQPIACLSRRLCPGYAEPPEETTWHPRVAVLHLSGASNPTLLSGKNIILPDVERLSEWLLAGHSA